MTAYKVAVVVGSIREDSLNRKIARAMCAATPDSLDCKLVEIGDLPLYDPDLDDAAIEAVGSRGAHRARDLAVERAFSAAADDDSEFVSGHGQSMREPDGGCPPV